ncbi:hypothetical protein [Lysinibacillus pakistanensis]|uniref:hypothetical protein n=1 Tax=Lysinibacillus pakistanensis TaxID=759811 RepID=UPI003D2BBC12
MEWRELMKGFIKGISSLFLIIFISLVLLTTKQPVYVPTIQTPPPTNYAEEIGDKLQASDFTKKTIIALRAAGYSPDSTIGYLVESPTNQIMTIHLHNIDKIDKSTESEIQYIVNRIAKNNNLHNFIVNVRLVDVSLQN